MIKKEITFENFEGKEVTETHYFNLGPKDIVDLEAEVGGDLQKWIRAEVESKDHKRAMAMLVKFISRAYGVRNGDSGFEKSDEHSDRFLTSLAFQGLFDDLLTDQDSINAFILGMFPKKMMAKADEVIAARKAAGETSPEIAEAARIIAEAAPEVKTAKEPVQAELPLPEDGSDPEITRQQEDLRSGLKYPRDAASNLVPWAFREPTRKEQGSMTQRQFVDVMRRKNDPEWEPTVGG